MKKTFQSVLTTSILVATAFAAAYRFVGFDGKPAAAGAKALGTNPVTADVGEQMPVDALGIVLVEAGAAIAQGAEVQSDANGRAITLAAGKSNGWALDAAAAAGDVIRIARGI